METVKRSLIARGEDMREKHMKSKEDFGDSENTLYDTIMLDTCQYMFVQSKMYNTKVNPKVNSRHWVIMVCQCRLISCNDEPLLWAVLTVWGGRCMRSLCLPLNCAVNLKLL